MHRPTLGMSALLAVVCLTSTATAVPIDYKITYQGELTNMGALTTGEFDMRFRLYAGPTGGSGLGPAIEFRGGTGNPPVVVEDGKFTVELNFGPSPFLTGDALWLQIEVRPSNGPPGYVVLNPRQPLTAAPFALYALNGTGGGSSHWVASGANIYNANTGNVGIGEPEPLGSLHVQRTHIGLPTDALTNDDIVVEDADAVIGIYSSDAGNRGSAVVLGEISDFEYRNKWAMMRNTSNAGNTLAFKYGTNPDYSANPTYMVITEEGRVGVGTTNPTGKFHAATSSAPGNIGIVATGYYGISANATNEDGWGGVFGGSGFLGSGKALLVFGESDLVGHVRCQSNVGIGTDDPSARLHVSDNDEQLAQFNQFGPAPGVVISALNSASIYPALSVTSTSRSAPTLQVTNTSGTALVVTGTANVDILEIRGADVAEKFPVSTSGTIEPGTVMEIDPANPGTLRICAHAYSKRVAGVTSGAGDIPVGAILGNMPGFEDAPAVALSGRVWVRCDATGGAIEPGDMLTTAAQPGHAMKASDASRSHGAILGKAMTGLKHGETGLVLTLVSLQ